MDVEQLVVHCKRDEFDVYVGRGRGSVWGNPFSHLDGTLAKFRVGSVEEAVQAHADWVVKQPELMARLGELKGMKLGCWCSSPERKRPCHARTLAKLTNAEEVN